MAPSLGRSVHIKRPATSSKLLASTPQLGVRQTPRQTSTIAMKGGVSSSRRCACHGHPFTLCRLIPTQTFGNSTFPAPIIALLRTIFHAASLDVECQHSGRKQRLVTRARERLSAGARFAQSVLKPRRLFREQSTRLATTVPTRLSTTDFLREVETSRLAKYRVISVTWVKALASHMSHEFIQFVAEDTISSRRIRFITDRQETGDWVTFCTEGEEPLYSDRHRVPLPLLSVNFSNGSTALSLTLLEMAILLAETSGKGTYNPIREHCWWYAETVFDAIRTQRVTELKEWPWSKYRYSFVLFNEWVKRKTLEAHACEFEQMCRKHNIF